jgi:hypothetical protein
MKPVEIRPWRKSPFTVGRRYRVRRDFESLRDSFRAGEVLTYDSDAWSRYHEYTVYAFSQPGAHELRVWDIRDDDELDIWRELFEEISV